MHRKHRIEHHELGIKLSKNNQLQNYLKMMIDKSLEKGYNIRSH